MRQLSSLLLLLGSGFFFQVIFSIALIAEPRADLKLKLLAVFFVLGSLLLVAGLAIHCFRGWRKKAGLVLLIVSAVNAFYGLVWFCMLMSPAIATLLGKQTLSLFGDVQWAAWVLVLQLGVGWLLYGVKRSQPA